MYRYTCINFVQSVNTVSFAGTPSAVIISIGIGSPLLLTLSLITATLALVVAVSKLKNRKKTRVLQTEIE